MLLKDLVKSIRDKKPPRIILHGPHKIGKSTWASKAPSPIFLPTESGINEIEVPALPVAQTLSEFFGYLGQLITEDHGFKTVVVDTLDWLEKLIFDQVCADKNVKNIEDIGYSKGYIFALSHWERFITGLDKLREKKVSIILLAHNEIKAFSPPDGPAYDRYQIKLHHKAATKLEEWADCILFANYKTFVSKEGSKGKATGGERVIYTSPNPSYRAGNRYSLPEELPMDINVLLKHIRKE